MTLPDDDKTYSPNNECLKCGVRIADELYRHRAAALAVAKLFIPKDAKERRVVQLQDVLHGKLFGLLREQLDRLPGSQKASILLP